ncbi:conserved hypothetical protein [Histoplasma capsulatum H143]|uniref:Uncharacterized protein n=1 Tax=Ajellomyces capsulatus (strain H143) TaxID=544712 RepID=C6H2L1_AJECH|nr:conserved hypothetical protein [Histoplasma capsulatum H143]
MATWAVGTACSGSETRAGQGLARNIYLEAQPKPTQPLSHQPSREPGKGNPEFTARAPADAPSDGNGVYPPECHVERDSKYPFCLPKNGSEVLTEQIYYVTWDSDLFPGNSTITIGLNYANSSENEGVSAYTSDRTENSYGFVTIQMDKVWLHGESRNNLSVYLVEYDPASKERAKTVAGPIISLINNPGKHYPPPPPTAVPNKLGLMIGLPVALGVIFVVLLGLYFGMKKNRRIGLGNIMGSRAKGYGGGKSRIERLGGGRGRRRDRGAAGAASVRLGELDDGEQYTYTDDLRGGRIRSDAEIFNESERARGNVFKEELTRMKSWR